MLNQNGVVDAPTPVAAESNPPDLRSLLALAQAGDAEAYGQVYRAYSTRLLRQAVALCGNVPLAEELAQDTLVEAWRCLPRYDGRCQFFTWLCAILLNRYRNTRRRARILPVSALGVREQEAFARAVGNLADQGPAPDQAAQSREQSALVRQCLEALPAKHRQVLHLRFYVDDSLEGIAAALGCSVGTVKSRLFHALNKLHRMKVLSSQFVDLETKD